MDEVQIKMLVHRLADCNKHTRDKALKTLMKDIRINSMSIKHKTQYFKIDDMLKLWKGLFYSMYMSDKSLVQESLAETISLVVHTLYSNNDKKCYIEAAFTTFAREWNGIDVFRLDKMMMLVRRVLRQTLTFLKCLGWPLEETVHIAKILEDTVICPTDNINSKPLGLKLHLCDIYMEEIAKIGQERLSHQIIIILIQPYMKVIALCTQVPYTKRVIERIMKHLMRQSDLGIVQGEGLIEGETMQWDSEDEEENLDATTQDDGDDQQEEDEPLDPRAGGVDVGLPQLDVNYGELANALQTVGSIPKIKQKKRNLLYRLAEQFRDLKGGNYPLATKTYGDGSLNMQKEKKMAVIRMQKYEKKLSLKYEIGNKRKRNKNVTVATLKSKDNDSDLEEDSEITKFEPMKKKHKNPKKKNNSDQKEKRGTRLKKDLALKKTVENKINSLNEEAGIPTIEEIQKIMSPSKKEKPMEFEVTEINGSVTTPNNKSTKFASTKGCLISPMNSFSVSDIVPEIGNSIKGSPKSKKSSDGILLNFSMKKNHQLGLDPIKFESEWDTPLKEGEIEYEVKSRKSIKRELTKISKSKKSKKNKSNLNGVKKNAGLSFNLKQNKEHPFSDYSLSVRNSPSIPYSAEKRPGLSVLKPSPSPILIHKPMLKALRARALAYSASPKLKKLKRL